MILREVQVKYKKNDSLLSIKKIKSDKDAVAIFREIWDKDDFDVIERCYAIFLGRNNNIIGYKLISIGGHDMTVVDPKIIGSLCINLIASAVVLAHNHPSGNLLASNADKKITEKLQETLKVIDVTLLDHIILTDTSYTSMLCSD